jgi:hypothetical protein
LRRQRKKIIPTVFFEAFCFNAPGALSIPRRRSSFVIAAAAAEKTHTHNYKSSPLLQHFSNTLFCPLPNSQKNALSLSTSKSLQLMR